MDVAGGKRGSITRIERPGRSITGTRPPLAVDGFVPHRSQANIVRPLQRVALDSMGKPELMAPKTAPASKSANTPSATVQPIAQSLAKQPAKKTAVPTAAQSQAPARALALPKIDDITPQNRRLSLKPGKWRRIFSVKSGLSLAALILIILSAYVSIDAYNTTNRAKAEFSKPQEARQPDAPVREGTDESVPAPDAIDSYKVAATMPRAITIDKLSVKARVLPMTVTASNELKTPVNTHDTGWYDGSSKPGEGGAMLINGHASGPTTAGIFGGLKKLVAGDKIKVERGDSTQFTYKVEKIETLAASKVDMSKLMVPIKPGTIGLTLITCGGAFDAKHQTFEDRVIVYASQIK